MFNVFRASTYFKISYAVVQRITINVIYLHSLWNLADKRFDHKSSNVFTVAAAQLDGEPL
jgi:hypothetical protein